MCEVQEWWGVYINYKYRPYHCLFRNIRRKERDLNRWKWSTIQGAIYFKDYWSQLDVDKIRECCCAPSFIISIASPWVGILGTVFLNRVVIQPLTDFIPLTIKLRIPDQVNRISRLFYALLVAFHRLQYFYQNMSLNPSDQRYFLIFKNFSNDDRVPFTYISEL